MDLAERLGMTLADVLKMDAREFALWVARDRQKAEQQQLSNLAAKAEGARRKRYA